MLTLWKLILMLTGSLALIMTLGLVVNSAIRPARNAMWNARVNSRCSKLEGDEKRSITVVIPCYTVDAIKETLARVNSTFKNSYCASRVKMVLVAYGDDAPRLTDLTQEIGRTMMFKGAADFSVTDSIQTVYGGLQLKGPWNALAKAAPSIAEDTDYVMLLTPSGSLVKNWDKTVVGEMNEAPRARHGCISTGQLVVCCRAVGCFRTAQPDG